MVCTAISTNCVAAAAAAARAMQPPKRVKAADRNKSHYPHRAVLRIDGMTCENCARRVENALNTLPGTWATADLAAGRATVLLKQPPETETLRQAVRQAGYLLLRVEESN